MKENVDKQLDVLAKKILKNASLESPSFSFTEQVMSQVNALSDNEITTYKPLISKRIWLLISASFVLTIAYIMYTNSGSTSGWLNTIDLSVLTNNKLTSVVSGFNMSQTAAYIIGLFALMICVQVTYLKHHFNKRFEA
jgi:hypothetical protein